VSLSPRKNVPKKKHSQQRAGQEHTLSLSVMRYSHSIATTSSSTSRFVGSATKRYPQKNVPRRTRCSSSNIISVTTIGPFREQSSSTRDRRSSVSSASFSGRITRTSSSLRRRTERTSRIESKNNNEDDERTRDESKTSKEEEEVEKSFDKALSKKLTTMAIPSAERKQNILLRTLTAVAITCAAIIPQISERPPTPAMSIGTARTSTLVVGATKSVLDDAGLKKEKDRKRSSWYAGTINL